MTDCLVALVTGANKGLGKEVARQLAQRQMTVLMGSRELARGTDAAAELLADGIQVEPVQIDVTDPASVDAVAARLQRDHGRLDVLINNAGTIVEAPAAEVNAAQMRQIFDVNVFGVVTTIGTLLPLLRASREPRIVNVASTTASLTLSSGGTDFGGDASQRLAYTTSKTALNMLTIQYSQAFKRDPGLCKIRINSAAPGYTATDLTHHRGTRSVGEGARVIVALATLPDDGPNGGFFNDQGPLPW
ncbi:SDR family oxidoreductase [Amycolatopsis sp. H20-H5]|uniref:SDR family oxidoreductase n=1 Tax=Amycolatopsis sp. H20-H5 TaxID=3046309 RepID=UPI002DBC86E5|nr:SDR family oxidoreductase [Amycolatopsis sp. H20-H5]MEC3974453.1 SDR family oxidoreductase [Amycolatopsis sp. H20-H5]